MREVTQVMYEMMRCPAIRSKVDDLRVATQCCHQRALLRFDQSRHTCLAVLFAPHQRLLRELPKHAGDTCVRILNIVDGVVILLRFGDIEIEIEVLVVRTRNVEKPRCIIANFFAQLP